MLISKNDEKVNEEWDVKTARYRIDNGYQVLVLVQGCKDLRLNQDGCLERTQ